MLLDSELNKKGGKLAITCIGTIIKEKAVRVVDKVGKEMKLSGKGYRHHFST